MSDCKYCHHKNNFNVKFCEICEKSIRIDSDNKNRSTPTPQSLAINFSDPMIEAKIEKNRKILYNMVNSSTEKTDAILSLCDLKREGSLKAKIILERYCQSPIESIELQKLAADSK